MDLVDLNHSTRGTKGREICRDPYGSRGSKWEGSLDDLLETCRDPYGSKKTAMRVTMILLC